MLLLPLEGGRWGLRPLGVWGMGFWEVLQTGTLWWVAPFFPMESSLHSRQLQGDNTLSLTICPSRDTAQVPGRVRHWRER